MTPMKNNRRMLWSVSLALMVTPWLLPNRYLLNVAVLIGIYALAVIGLNLLIGYAGQISLGHAAFFGIGAYGAAILTTRFHWDPFLALAAAACLVAGVAWVIGRPALKLQGHYLAMATLGFGIIVQIFMDELVEWTGGTQGMSNIPKLSIGGYQFSGDFQLYFLVWGLIVLVQLLLQNLLGGKIGRIFLAIHTNETAAESLGINTARLKVQVFVFSAVLAGVAGGLYAYAISYISPEPFGFGFSVLLLTMVAIGGMGSLWGPVVGTVLLGVLPELLRSFKDFDILIYGVLLMMIIFFLPKGVVALLEAAWRAVLPLRRGKGVHHE